MSALAQLADYLHFSLVCKRLARRLRRRVKTPYPSHAPASRGDFLRLHGKVADAQWVTAPLTGARIPGYRILVETVSRYWINRRVVVDYCELGDFTLRTAEGDRPVGGHYGQLIAAEACSRGQRARGSADDPKAMPPELIKILANRAQLRIEDHDPRHYRWYEYHLHEGDEIFVDGVWGKMDPPPEQPESGAADGQQLKMGIVGASRRPLLVSRIPHGDLLRDLSDPDEALMRSLPVVSVVGDSGL